MDFVIGIRGATNSAAINAVEDFIGFTVGAIKKFTNFGTVENFTSFKIVAEAVDFADFTITAYLRNLEGKRTKETTSPEKNTAIPEKSVGRNPEDFTTTFGCSFLFLDYNSNYG
jgi:hypothetical protein